MAIRTHSDGISNLDEMTIPLRHARGTSRKDVSSALQGLLRASVPSFEGAIADVETYWRAVPREGDPAVLSLAWYAKKILGDIRKMRAVLDGYPTVPVETAVVWAVALGTLITEAQWRFGLGDAARLGGKVRAKNRAAAKARGADILVASTKLDIAINAAVLEYRKRHPGHSGRTLCTHVAKSLGISADTLRRRLTHKKTDQQPR